MGFSGVLRSRAVRVAAVWVLTAAAAVVVFRGVDRATLLRSLTTIAPGWAALGVLLDLLSYVLQGLRWSILLRPIGCISVVRTTQAVYAGLFINDLLPLRVGEIARALLVARWMARPVVDVIPSMVMERLFEGLWLAAGVGAASLFAPLPTSIVRAGESMGAVVLALTLGFIALILHRHRKGIAPSGPASGPRALRWKPLAWLVREFLRLESGFRAIGLSRRSLAAFFASLGVLALQAASFAVIVKSAGLDLPARAIAAAYVMIRLGTVLPNAPANVGSYQFFTAAALELFGVDKAAAAAFSITSFLLFTVPVWIIGAFALGRSGMTLAEIRAHRAGWAAGCRLPEPESATGDETGSGGD